MGLFDTLAGQAVNAFSNSAGSGHPGLMEAVTELIGGSGTGGLQALVNSFHEQGLGEVVSSWIGTGQNLPITADQLHSVLGSEQVQAIAQKLGLSSSDAAHALANLLPQVVDKLTPNGQLPEGNLVEQGLALLKGFGGNA
jgi:uncharacterized protein YidB (DUF937 family)